MNWLDALFLLGNAFFLYVTLVFLLTYLENRERILRNPKPKRFPSMSVIIPAFNEKDTIAATIRAVAAMRYPKRIEIIVVDDGSADSTLAEARRAAKTIKNAANAVVRVITQRNAGKAAALNAGIRIAAGELIATVDADSFPHEDALLKLVGYFNDERVEAVTASVKIHSPHSYLQFLQFVEYISMNFLRKMASFLQGISCVPGPLSVFRARAFKKIGGFDEGNITEDTEIALRMQRSGMRIENALDAVVECDTPYSLSGLVKQRVRWYHGSLENAKKHSALFFDRKFSDFGWFIYPTNFIAVAFAILVLFRLFVLAWQRVLRVGFGVVSNSAGASAAVAGGAASGAAQPSLWSVPWEIIKLFFDPNVFFTLDVAFVAIYLAVVLTGLYLGFKAAGERFKLGMAPVYISYLFVYSFIVTATWALSVFRFAARAKPAWLTTKKTGKKRVKNG